MTHCQTVSFFAASFLSCIAWVATVSPAVAFEGPTTKTEVGIVFQISDTRYTDHFADEELSMLERAGAQMIAGVMDDTLRFLHFTTNELAPYVLTVKLDRAEGSHAQAPAEFGLHMLLEGLRIPPTAQTYVLFRPLEQFRTPLGDRDTLLREIEGVIREANYRDLVSTVFRHIAFADDAEFNPSPLGWILNHNRYALCFDRGSRLHILSTFPIVSLGGTTKEFFEARVLIVDRPDHRIVSMANQSVQPEMIAQLKSVNPLEVSVEQIFVLEYRRACSPQPISGDAVDFSLMEAPR